MNENDRVVEQFEANRPHLRVVAFRMLGSMSEAEDAVQEAWLRLSRTGTGGVDNLGGWLTTVVARSVFQSVEDRDGMVQSGMQTGATETNDRLAEILAELSKS
jgi:DNA-directed RNA polymerase specialized sigma24 family protein